MKAQDEKRSSDSFVYARLTRRHRSCTSCAYIHLPSLCTCIKRSIHTRCSESLLENAPCVFSGFIFLLLFSGVVLLLYFWPTWKYPVKKTNLKYQLHHKLPTTAHFGKGEFKVIFVRLHLLKKLPCLVCCHVVGGISVEAGCLWRDAAEARLVKWDMWTAPTTVRSDEAPERETWTTRKTMYKKQHCVHDTKQVYTRLWTRLYNVT